MGSEWDPKRHANRDKKRDASGDHNVKLTAAEFASFERARDLFRVNEEDPDISEGQVVHMMARLYLGQNGAKK